MPDTPETPAAVTSRHTDAPDLEAAHRLYYRWWTIRGWWGPRDRGLKLGPVTVHAFREQWDRFEPAAPWFWGATVLGRVVVDSYLEHLRRP